PLQSGQRIAHCPAEFLAACKCPLRPPPFECPQLYPKVERTNMYTIATLHHLRSHLGLAAADTSEDVRLMDALRAAAAQIERAAGRHFLPRRTTIVHREGIRSTELLLGDDLLELIAVEDANGTIPLEDVVTLPANGPASVLTLKNGRFFTPGEN